MAMETKQALLRFATGCPTVPLDGFDPEFTLVCKLHAKYYKHSYYKPCTCNPKTVNRWIKDLNLIWDNGNKTD